jgi:hypothetical protein
MEQAPEVKAPIRDMVRAIADPEIKIVGSKARVAKEPAGVRAEEKATAEATVREANKDRIRDAEGSPDRIDRKL